jgi:hypothetical protein
MVFYSFAYLCAKYRSEFVGLIMDAMKHKDESYVPREDKILNDFMVTGIEEIEVGKDSFKKVSH